MKYTRSICIVGIGAAVYIWYSEPAPGQTQLTEIVVEAPSPIVRPRPAPPGPGVQIEFPDATAVAVQQPGWLPIVADQFATVTVMTSEELRRTPGATLGDVLFAKPGITSSSFAPGAASRPIVRGLDSYRVGIQENGIGASGVSELGEDHAVPLDPLAADRIEVVRGRQRCAGARKPLAAW